MFAAIAEYDLGILGERVRAGQARSGNFGGRQQTIPNETRVAIKKAYSEGGSTRSVGRQFGVSPMTVLRIAAEDE